MLQTLPDTGDQLRAEHKKLRHQIPFIARTRNGLTIGHWKSESSKNNSQEKKLVNRFFGREVFCSSTLAPLSFVCRLELRHARRSTTGHRRRLRKESVASHS